MSAHDTNSLRSISAELCVALDQYVSVLESQAQPTDVIPAMDRVREVADRFAQASVLTTGWGSPFVSPADEDEVLIVPSSSAPEVVEVTVTHLIKCSNPTTAKAVVQRRLAEAGIPEVPDEIDSISGIVQALEDIDGWKPERYNDPHTSPLFEVLTKSWSIRPQTSPNNPSSEG